MTVNIIITEQEENDISKDVQDFDCNFIEKRINLARALAKKCNIPFELIDSVTIEGNDYWTYRVYDKGRDT